MVETIPVKIERAGGTYQRHGVVACAACVVTGYWLDILLYYEGHTHRRISRLSARDQCQGRIPHLPSPGTLMGTPFPSLPSSCAIQAACVLACLRGRLLAHPARLFVCEFAQLNGQLT